MTTEKVKRIESQIMELQKEIDAFEEEKNALEAEIQEPDMDEDGEAGELYDEFLSECYPDYEIEGVTISPYRILKECDPIAYSQGLAGYFDDEEQRARLTSVQEAKSRIDAINEEIEDYESDIETLKEELLAEEPPEIDDDDKD